MKTKIKFEFLTISSYEGTESTGQIRLIQDLRESIEGKDVLILEDIVDTGRSMKYLLEYLNTKQVFNGIPTLINYSVKDLFNLCAYKTLDEIDEISSSILATFNNAAKYIQGGANE